MLSLLWGACHRLCLLSLSLLSGIFLENFRLGEGSRCYAESKNEGAFEDNALHRKSPPDDIPPTQ